MSKITEPELGEIEALFVQTSSGFESSEGRIVLKGVGLAVDAVFLRSPEA